MFDFLSDKLSSVFTRLTGQGYLSEKNIQDTVQKIQDSLLEADVPYDVVNAFITEIKSDVVGQKVLKSLKPAEQFTKLVHDRLISFLSSGKNSSDFTFKTPATIMVMGLQGSGKTTTISKLAHHVLSNKKNAKIIFGSVDFYRPAAVDQLEVLAQKVNVTFYRSSKTDPISAAADIMQHAKQQSADYLFLDTAGRLHVDDAMLEELQKIDSVVKPNHKLLVLDSMTGQESLRVAQSFNEKIGFDGAILTKLDSDSRAGCAFAFGYTLQKPLLFVGTGEKIDDLERFRPERIATRILGMGDMQTLIERANQKIKKTEQQRAEKAFSTGRMTLDDFASQINMMNRLGSFSQLARFIPGMPSQAVSQGALSQAEGQMTKFKVIIGSMTKKERLNHKILDGSRKKRIAQGSGVAVSDVNMLLERFEQMQQFAKLFKKMGKFPGM